MKMKLVLQSTAALLGVSSASANLSYWVPPIDKPGGTCDFKKIKIPNRGEYTCLALGSSICRDNGGNFGKWWFGVEEVETEYTNNAGAVFPITDTFPVLVDPAGNRYPITGTDYTEDGSKCEVGGEVQRDDNYAGTTHICIGETTETDYSKYSHERPYLFFYNEKTLEYPYQLVCDGIGTPGKLPMIKMVNNEDLAFETYIEYPVDITKFKKGFTADPTDANELWKMFIDWNGYADPPLNQVGQLAARIGVAHPNFCKEYLNTDKKCWEEDCSDVLTPNDPPYDTCPSPIFNFPQPPEVRSVDGVLYHELVASYATNRIDTPTPVDFYHRSYNGNLVGATLRLRAGDHMTIPNINQLPPNAVYNVTNQNQPHDFNSINLHTHGFHVSPNQDNIFVKIDPDEEYDYEYDIPAEHPAGTFWYHPHKHGAITMQLFSGMFGTIIIEGDEENGDLNSVPEIAAAEDVVLNINELNLEDYGGGIGVSEGQTFEVADYTNPSPFGPAFFRRDSVFVVNGIYEPEMEISPFKVVRLRLLNAGPRGAVRITVESKDDGSRLPMHLCARDGITMPRVQVTTSINLAPANRADVLVMFPRVGEFEIIGTVLRNVGAPPRVVLASVNAVGDPSDMRLYNGPLPIPQDPNLQTIDAAEVTENRTLTYTLTSRMGAPILPEFMPPPDECVPPFMFNRNPCFFNEFTINGKQWDRNRVDQHITIGDVIDWTFENPEDPTGVNPSRDHPHHIHIHPFQVYETSNNMLNGMPFPPPGTPGHQPVWMDTISIPLNGYAKARQRFPDFPGQYVLHCHILTHEDIGMMSLVELSPRP
mmetsp:Transcript_15469/g.33432  ORF Transcript_15469/g.33432 Transcript_15469/m.33432 type:complete len:818 (+) Transcript_15469:75-2528(+)